MIPSMYISRVMVSADQIKKQKFKHVVRESKKVTIIYGILPTLSLRYKTNQGSKGSFLTEALLMLQGSARVRCLFPSSKREKVEDLTFDKALCAK